MSLEFKALAREWAMLEIRIDGTMYQETQTKSQLVLPEMYRPLILDELHKEMGHLKHCKGPFLLAQNETQNIL